MRSINGYSIIPNFQDFEMKCFYIVLKSYVLASTIINIHCHLKNNFINLIYWHIRTIVHFSKIVVKFQFIIRHYIDVYSIQ